MKLSGMTTGRRGDARIAKDRSTDWSRVMTERIDHYAAAVGMLKDAQSAQDLSLIGIISQGAQVHATLALVEQQKRVADWLESCPRNYQDAPIVETRNGGES